MGRKQFKAESKRLLDLMINSIYTHREIFLRELISNASDALDKLYYKALTEHLSDVSREELGIDLALDKEARLLIIRDNGIGMTKEELETTWASLPAAVPGLPAGHGQGRKRRRRRHHRPVRRGVLLRLHGQRQGDGGEPCLRR